MDVASLPTDQCASYSDDTDRCTVCGTPAENRYNQSYWCDRHLQQRLAREH